MGFAPRRTRTRTSNRGLGNSHRYHLYQEMLDKLFSARRFGMDLGLERIESALNALGNPHLRIETRVVIGGTNGKGSTAAFLESISIAGGRKTGVFSSPHLSSFAERFRLNGQSASIETIVAAHQQVVSVGPRLTFFEQCTAMAALLFANAGVELAIFEVGLGGRLDSTRAVVGRHVIITGVAFDHQAILGDSLAAIATEKMAVASAADVVVVGASGAKGSQDALRLAASNLGIDISHVIQSNDIAQVPQSLGLRGAHQRSNAAAAQVMAERMGLGRFVDKGLRCASLAGRLERIGGSFKRGEQGSQADQDALVIVDGAHNGHGARALATALMSMEHRSRSIGIMAVSCDKTVGEILAPLVSMFDELWLSAAANDRALDTVALAKEVADLTGEGTGQIRVVATSAAAAAAAKTLAADCRVVVFGSLIYVGEFRAAFLGPKLVHTDPIVLTDPR